MNSFQKIFASSMVIVMLAVNAAFTAPPEKIGVLILAHGGSVTWNQLVDDAAKPIREKYPVEIAFGMALPRTIQEGIDKLESKGINKIVVVPLFVSSHSFIIRQTEFLLRKRETLADPAVVMDHSAQGHGASHGQHHQAMNHGSHHAASASDEKASLTPLSFKSEIILVSALDDHSIVADIIFSRINELSVNPPNETIIIVGHGPNPEEDNRKWVAAMESLTDQVREKQKQNGVSSRAIFCITVRDDADKEIYAQAREHLRGLVRQAGKSGDVIIIPLLLSKGGVEQGIIKRLEGLTYKWNGNTLLPDPMITRFIESSVSQALSK
jgi:sirohydrochlorin cobaltochelatase